MDKQDEKIRFGVLKCREGFYDVSLKAGKIQYLLMNFNKHVFLEILKFI